MRRGKFALGNEGLTCKDAALQTHPGDLLLKGGEHADRNELKKYRTEKGKFCPGHVVESLLSLLLIYKRKSFFVWTSFLPFLSFFKRADAHSSANVCVCVCVYV